MEFFSCLIYSRGGNCDSPVTTRYVDTTRVPRTSTNLPLASLWLAREFTVSVVVQSTTFNRV
jgi:hypothetical protein